MSTKASVNRLLESGLFAACLIGLLAEQAAAATLADNPHVGPPTSATALTGAGYAPNEQVDVYFDNALVKTAVANTSGAFSGVKLIVPGNAVPELHVIKVVGHNSHVVSQAQFWVHTDWPQAESSAGHTNANAFENLLNSATLQTAHVLWSKPVPGYPAGGTPGGEIPPIVANGRAYVATGQKLSCYKTATGTYQWTRTIGAGLTSPAALPIPAANGYVVFAGTNTGVAAHKEDGTPLWIKSLPGAGWSVAAAADGLVFAMQAGLNAPGRLYALDGATGAIAWAKVITTGYADRPAVSNGALYTITAGGTTNLLVAYDAITGKTLWTRTVAQPNSNWLTSVAATKDAVYVSAIPGSGGVSADHAGVYAYQTSNGTPKWFHPSDLPAQRIAAIGGGYVYLGYDLPTAHAGPWADRLNATTGAFINTIRGTSGLRNIIVANNIVYGDDRDDFQSTLTASAWTNASSLVRFFNFPNGIFGGLAIADGKIFHWNGGNLEVLGN